MAPCMSTGALSMRHASTAMSCVAALSARRSAQIASGSTPAEGWAHDMLKRQMTMHACATSIQLRRRPSQRVRKGTGTRSTTGAQRNLKEYARPTHESMPMVERLIPSSASHAVSVW